MDLTILTKIFQIIIELITGLQGEKKTSGSPKWRPVLDPDAYARAKKRFLENIESYRGAKIRWTSGRKKGRRYNLLSMSKEGSRYRRVYSKFTKKGAQSFMKTIHVEDCSKADYDSFAGNDVAKVTWCNQACSLWVFEYTKSIGNKVGIDLDYFPEDGKLTEHNANRIYKKLVAGDFNTDEFRFGEYDDDFETLSELAYDGALVIPTLYKKRGRGHLAPVSPESWGADTLIVDQAGATTGENIRLQKGFTNSNVPFLKYFVLEEAV